MVGMVDEDQRLMDVYYMFMDVASSVTQSLNSTEYSSCSTVLLLSSNRILEHQPVGALGPRVAPSSIWPSAMFERTTIVSPRRGTFEELHGHELARFSLLRCSS